MTLRTEKFRTLAIAVCCMAFATSTEAKADPISADTATVEAWRASLESAWWTGPLFAAGAETLPKGRVYTEPYLFDYISRVQHSPGSISYVQYGLTDDITVGLLPRFAFGTNRSQPAVMLGDFKLLSHVRLTKFTPEQRIPTLAVVLQETIPTGRHDRLKGPARGQGGGVFATAVGLNAQYYFRTKNGRLLRTRINIMKSFPHRAKVRGRSVYGTSAGFRGWAKPGSVTTVIVAAEYSVTQRWVGALDLIYEATKHGHVDGQVGNEPATRKALPASRYLGLAPAVEYNWNSSEGVIFGVRLIPKQGNTPASITPAIAFSKAW